MVGVLFSLYNIININIRNRFMSEIKLRPVTKEDADIILEWRNDNESRENSFSKDIISHDDHMSWFDKKMADEKCHMYMLTDDDVPVGHIRIDRVNDIGEISYMTAPDKRGMGYGRKIIAECEKVLPDGISVLIGMTLKDNEGSVKCFTANEYSEFTGGNLNCYIKTVR